MAHSNHKSTSNLTNSNCQTEPVTAANEQDQEETSNTKANITVSFIII